MKPQLNLRLKHLLVGICGLLVYTYLVYSEEGVLPVQSERFPQWGGSLLFAYFAMWVVDLSDKILEKRFSWRTKLYLRLILSVTSGFLMVAVTYFLALGIFYDASYFSAPLFERDAEESERLIKLALLVWTCLFMYQIIQLVVYSFRSYAETQLASASLKRKQLELQVEALSSQLSPHFLFNSLNTISSLVAKDSALAEQFIRRLAQTYQYVMNTHQKELVNLGEELEFVKAYNFLLRIRFQDAICLQVNVPDEAFNTKVPPLSVQLLVENAVKHNELEEGEKLTIIISLTDAGRLKVRNNKTAQPGKATSLNVGLKNIQKRYEILNETMTQTEDERHFEVELPLIS